MRLQEHIRTTVARAPASDIPTLVGVLAEGQAAAMARLVSQSQAPAEQRSAAGSGLLTYAEAADHLRCSQSYIETMVRQGKVRAVTLPATAKGSGEHRRERAGRSRRIRLSDLQALTEG